MGLLADDYLKKAAVRDPLVPEAPHPGLQLIVTIPAYDEPGLQICLDSLFRCRSYPGPAGGSGTHDPSDPVRSGTSALPQTEVLILFNAPADAPPEILQRNRQTCRKAEDWIRDHPHPRIRFHTLLDHTFPPGKAGVGLARKILMDEAVRRFARVGKVRNGQGGSQSGIIASLDADTVVDPNYLQALVDHFKQTGTDGCSIYFEHPLTPEEDPFHIPLDPSSRPDFQKNPYDAAIDPRVYEAAIDPRVYEAVAAYELHLRYYVIAVRSTGYPYAFQTVGSAFAVRSDVYAMEGGMNRRQGGEDFYFIQKVALRGNFTSCQTTRVVPSPRPSDRVPFGTGPAVKRIMNPGKGIMDPGKGIMDPGKGMRSYNLKLFLMLRDLFRRMEEPGQPGPMLAFRPHPVLQEFLKAQHFEEAMEEIRKNNASSAAFRKRFWRWFHMFRIMKFLHFARDRGYPDVPVTEAAVELLGDTEGYRGSPPPPVHGFGNASVLELLQIYRRMDRGPIPPLP